MLKVFDIDEEVYIPSLDLFGKVDSFEKTRNLGLIYDVRCGDDILRAFNGRQICSVDESDN